MGIRPSLSSALLHSLQKRAQPRPRFLFSQPLQEDANAGACFIQESSENNTTGKIQSRLVGKLVQQAVRYSMEAPLGLDRIADSESTDRILRRGRGRWQLATWAK